MSNNPNENPKENLKPEDIRSIRLICVQKQKFVQFVFKNLKSWIICIFFNEKFAQKHKKFAYIRKKQYFCGRNHNKTKD